jgi:hypothetical protein
LDLGEVLRVALRPEEATDVIAQALALFERKGNLVSADRARALLSTSR